nr:PD-(D/E)XK nuclease domain-containing protein [uncultured Desulfobacter sp.]
MDKSGFILGLNVTPEDTTNHGRIDMTVQLNDNKVYLFEFKVVDIDKTPGTARHKSGKKAMQTSFVIIMPKFILSVWNLTEAYATSSGLNGNN